VPQKPWRVLCAVLTTMLASSLAGGCFGRTPKPVGSALAARKAQPFVPPFAYEAYVRGELALAQGDADTAALQLELATAAPDEDAYLLSRLADAQEQTGDRTLGERTMREAERVDPCQQNIWLTRGSWAEQDGELGVAEQAYTRALGCDPSSDRALLALYRVLLQKGEPERGLALLTRAGARSSERAKGLFVLSLHSGSAAETRYALDSWLSLGPPDRALLEAALTAALSRDGTLTLSLSELALPGLEPATRAKLALAALDVDTARALLAMHQDGELGGAAQAARLAMLAGDLERAELYASVALKHDPDDSLRVLRASSLAALGDAERVLEELRSLHDPAQRRSLLLRELEAIGMPALAHELTPK
jgi:tetratricopeptide (TPR) repeat protein